jgi:predicted dehydrogenase
MTGELKKFQLGLVGCGRISQSWLEAIKHSKHVHLVSVMDLNPNISHPIAELTGCASFTELEPFIQHKKLDGVILCTPPVTHASIACRLMQEGISVLCEKPLAVTLEEGHRMYEVAKQHEVVLMMASKFRYVEDIIRTKSIIQTGLLGNIHFYSNQFCAQINMSDRWNSNPQVSGGGVIMDNGPHAVDIIRYLMGPITKIHAHESTRSPQLNVEDTSTLSVITKNNVIATIHLSWALTLKSNSYIEIYGTEGAIKVGWQESTYQHSGHPNWIHYGVGYQKVHAFKNQLENFINTIHGVQEPLITAEDGLASIGIIEAAYESLKTGKWVSLEESLVHA